MHWNTDKSQFIVVLISQREALQEWNQTNYSTIQPTTSQWMNDESGFEGKANKRLEQQQ